MFMLTMGEGTSLGFPDVCITPIPSPAGPVPTPLPYPNTSESATAVPCVYTVLIDCMPVVNTLTEDMVSEGDDVGVETGLVSHMISGETGYEVGCFTIFVGGLPAQRLTSVTGMNSMVKLPNAPGMTSVPSQVTVLALG